MAKINPITIRAASLTLSGSIATVVGTVSTDAANGTTGAFALGSLTALRLACNYARHVSSTTGRPRFEVDLSMDAPTTAAGSVANFVPVQLLDSSTFSAGAIDGYAMRASLAPSATGTTVHGIAPVDVRGAHWARVRLLDEDGTNPGAISALVFGGET
jgi:hypothetical protein